MRIGLAIVLSLLGLSASLLLVVVIASIASGSSRAVIINSIIGLVSVLVVGLYVIRRARTHI